MSPFIAELTATALGELCAGSAMSIGGVIGVISLRASAERRGQLSHGTGANAAPVSNFGLAVLATVLLLFGTSLVAAGLSTANAPTWAIIVLAFVFLLVGMFGLVAAARHEHEKTPNKAPEPTPGSVTPLAND